MNQKRRIHMSISHDIVFLFKKKKRNEALKIGMQKTREIVKALAKAGFSPESPAQEAFSNVWLLRDIAETLKPQITSIFAVGGSGFDCVQSFLSAKAEIFSIATNSWSVGSSVYVNPDGSLALFDNNIFVVDGYKYTDDPSSDVFMMPITPSSEILDSRDKMPALERGRRGSSVGVVGDKIFVLGGLSQLSGLLSEVKVLLVKERKWVDAPPMTIGKMHMGVTVIGKNIYVFGGFTNQAPDFYLNAVEVFDTVTSKWFVLPSMKIARINMGIATIDDRFVWILGGYGRGDKKLDSIEVFDVERNEWSVPPIKMKYPDVITNAIASDHRIFIFGKQKLHGEVLDIDEMKWSSLPPMKTPRHSPHCVGF